MENILVIPILSKIKQSRAGKHMEPLKFKCFIQEPKLCVVTHMSAYLQKTKELRCSEKLFLSVQKPHSEVGKDTIARWCKTIMAQSGIDTNKYSSHSSRAAATCKAKQRGASMPCIMKYAGWSGEQTFARFYDKDIVNNEVFQETLM